MRDVDVWQRDPESFLRQQGLKPQLIAASLDKEVFVLIVEGFLIFNYRYTEEDYSHRVYISYKVMN